MKLGIFLQRVDHREGFGSATSLVALELSDEVPDTVLRKGLNLGQRLLQSALAKVALPGIIGGSNEFDRNGLRHGNEGDFCRIAPGTF